MPYQRAISATKTMDKLARTIAVPAENNALRLPTFPNVERTATVRFAHSSPGSIDHSGSLTGFLCRSPVYPLWVQQLPAPLRSGTGASAGISTQYLTGTQAPRTEGTHLCVNDHWFSTLHHGSATPACAIIGQINREFYLYVPAGATLIILLWMKSEGGTFSGTVGATVDIWESEDDNTLKAVGGTASSELVPIIVHPNSACWVKLSEVTWAGPLPTQVQQLTLGWSTSDSFTDPTNIASIANSIWPVPLVPLEFETSEAPYLSTRTTAVAALFQNVTKVLNKEGTTRAARLITAAVNPWEPPKLEAALDAVNQTERFTGRLEQGFYTFTLPDASSERFVDCTTDVGKRRSNGLTIPCMPLTGMDYYNIFSLTDRDAESATNLNIVLSQHLEFRTSSMLFTLGMSMVKMEEYHASQLALTKQGVFYENPTHLAVIGKLVGQAVASLAPMVVPHVKKAAVNVGKSLLTAAMTKLTSSQTKARTAGKTGKKARTVTVRVKRQRK